MFPDLTVTRFYFLFLLLCDLPYFNHIFFSCLCSLQGPKNQSQLSATGLEGTHCHFFYLCSAYPSANSKKVLYRHACAFDPLIIAFPVMENPYRVYILVCFLLFPPSLPPVLLYIRLPPLFLSFSTYNYFPVVCLTPSNNFTSSQPHTIFFYKVLRAPKSILFEEIFLYMLSLYFLVLFTFLFLCHCGLKSKSKFTNSYSPKNSSSLQIPHMCSVHLSWTMHQSFGSVSWPYELTTYS